MTTTLRPHDLIWLTAGDALEGITESWVDAAWHTGLPVVVRRDVDNEGRIPVGVRGLRRNQRAAGWVKPAAFAVCHSAAGSGGASACAAVVAVDVGDNRQYGLRAGDRHSGDPRR